MWRPHSVGQTIAFGGLSCFAKSPTDDKNDRLSHFRIQPAA